MPPAGSPWLLRTRAIRRVEPGQTTRVDGFRCRAAKNGITCTRTGGAGKGRGFVIDAADVHTVGGA